MLFWYQNCPANVHHAPRMEEWRINVHTNRNRRIRKAILLCGVAFPVSYLVSLAVYWVTYFLNTPEVILFITVPPIVTIACLMVSFHVIALIYVFAPREDDTAAHDNTEEDAK